MKNHQAHGKKQWYCSSRDVHGCRADVITYKDIYYLPSHRTGSMVLIFKDNKYWINNRYQNTINWTCRDRKRIGCTSCVQTTVEVLLVKGRNGKDLLMLNGYTYYQHKLLRDGFRWSCTQMGSRSCRGFLHVTNEMLVVRAHTEHTHPPSTYFLESIRDSAKDENKKSMEAINPLALKIGNVHGRALH
ncbi:uncharacterized protein LOC115447839 [Manduca sexta]|uniref:uncharacterized protein LOC115447839 n=1 Tax=Manduca sexta TaxID=7130 RepID=UPI00188E6450|nr:uncharacterized protein LOC115447839 [Manduca sexta]XP_037296911.1 uncharacterized protein LOC115447839 [Manduca sexta]